MDKNLLNRIEALEKEVLSLKNTSTIPYEVDKSFVGRGFVKFKKITTDPTITTGVFTVTIASPAVFTTSFVHGLLEGQSIYFTTTGALPTGLTALTTYYVIATGLTATTFRVSATPGGAAVNTTGSQSGVHTYTAIGFADFSPVLFGLIENTPGNLPDLFVPLYSISDLAP